MSLVYYNISLLLPLRESTTVLAFCQIQSDEAAVMPKDELIAYKAMLDREVDHQDIQEMSAASR